LKKKIKNLEKKKPKNKLKILKKNSGTKAKMLFLKKKFVKKEKL
jgi:hypothetical protein